MITHVLVKMLHMMQLLMLQSIESWNTENSSLVRCPASKIQKFAVKINSIYKSLKKENQLERVVTNHINGHIGSRKQLQHGPRVQSSKLYHLMIKVKRHGKADFFYLTTSTLMQSKLSFKLNQTSRAKPIFTTHTLYQHSLSEELKTS